MVLINGVKYACDRCIRGHRVTTCTHTDQPLTMIKPKGRPASQCHHCREQRKAKSLHVTCTCGKKGKSPGMHLASCLCHKNSVCTCSSNASKKGDKSKEKLNKSLSELNTVNLNAHNNLSHGNIPHNTPPSSAAKDVNFVIEDVVMPFDTGSGLLDLFSPAINKYGSNFNDDTSSSSMSPVERANANGMQLNKPAESTIDHSDGNIFPLFPLVGTQSFDDSKSQPLLLIPDTHKFNSEISKEETNSNKTDLADKNLNNIMPNIRPNDLHQDSVKVPAYFQPIRPKRPDSVVSMASTSSSATNGSRNFDNLRYSGSAVNVNPPSINDLLDNKINDEDKLKEMNQDTDLFDSSNVFMDHHQLQLNEYNQVLKSFNGLKLLNNTQAENSKNVDLIYQDIPGRLNQGQFYLQGGGDLEYPSFNDIVSASSFDSKNDVQN